jgi:phage tail protein X
LFTTADHLLGDPAALDSDSTPRRRLRHYAAPDSLVIDEVGCLSYSNRHADLLFELVSRRYQHKSTVVTTNKAFADWGEVFPNAACVVSLVDRLMHRAEVVRIEGDSCRAEEAHEGPAGLRSGYPVLILRHRFVLTPRAPHGALATCACRCRSEARLRRRIKADLHRR